MLLLPVMMVQASALENALTKARELQLSQSRYWHLLLHMPGEVSEIDDPTFFLAKEGKTNAGAELEATLAALYNETRLDDNATGCRFPARRHWLETELELQELPPLRCDAYDSMLKRVDPQTVTLVFSSAHINSPASMFGHTFLRIDSSYDSKMLSHAINYAAGADPDKENGFLFAIKGLFGGYPGFYSMLPYYEKLKEYRDTEQRDIWEYDLNLTHAEVMMMIRHIWELKGVYNWYYFFDENCSYNMLWLIEIARPDARLRDHFIYQVIPMETIYAAEEEGVVSHKHYRPSKRTVLLAYESVLDDAGRAAAIALAEGRIAPAEIAGEGNCSVQKRRYMLEAASELAQYRLMKGELARSEYRQRSHAILSARASLGKGTPVPIKQPQNPDEGHRAVRAMGGTGWRDGLPYQMIGIRPAYHALSDSDIGYMPGTQIEFLDFALRYDQDGVAVEKATLLSIASIAPVSAFFTPFSWRTHFGWDQSFYTRKTVFSAAVGAGYCTGGSWGFVYAMVDPELYIADEAVAAVKPSVGLVLEQDHGSKLTAEGGYRFYADGMRQWYGNAGYTLRLSSDNALQLDFDYTDKSDGAQRTFLFSFAHYY